MMNHRCVLFLAVFAFASCRAAAQAPHDGDWWRGLSAGTKQCVITGFLDGMALGENLSLMGTGSCSDPNCRSTIAQSYTYVRNRYFQDVPPEKIVAALDELYADAENASIILGRAVWIAVNRIAGTGEDEIQKLTQQSRGMRY